jgi:cyclopropane-fatty-acyl-phospholipid synthase
VSTVDEEAFTGAAPAESAATRGAEQRGTSAAGLARRLLARMGDPPIAIRLWTGETVGPANPRSTVSVRNRRAFYRLGLDPERQFGDLYSEGEVEVDGDLVEFLESVYAGMRDGGYRERWLPNVFEALRRRSAHTLAAARENIHRHYDLGNDFYSLWLGSTMQYTCAYYAESGYDLDAAQTAKMDHVCRKVWLKPGESVVEAGCGWGSLGLHMARAYGVKVRAFNISREQVEFARERARALGLADRVEYVLDDYRNISGQYDAFVSIGMLEHVGPENYPVLGSVIRRAIGSRGRAIVHSIGRDRAGSMNPWIEARIFPGGHPPSISEMMTIFEPAGLSVLDIENLRLHYARTLRHWLEHYQGAAEQVRSKFGEHFLRMWRLYLSGSIAAFTTGDLQLFQAVVAPRENNDVPRTRAHLYGGR